MWDTRKKGLKNKSKERNKRGGQRGAKGSKERNEEGVMERTKKETR